MNPKIVFHKKKIIHNVKAILKRCHQNNIQVAGVTKSVCGYPPVVDLFAQAGIDMIGDSRVRNLVKASHDLPRLLVRMPMLSEIEDLVAHVDISLNSELVVIKKIQQICVDKKLAHNIILMIDLGDLREGIIDHDEIKNTVEKIKEMSHVNLSGVGTNLTCIGGIIPTRQKMNQLITITGEIEQIYGQKMKYISGGNSSSLPLLFEGKLPKEINHLRLGESLIFGRETAYGHQIEGTYDDAIHLSAEIIEIKEKPSYPIGEVGMDAFGQKPEFEDLGIRRRAILAIGKQDIAIQNLTPMDKDITFIGSSSDHLLVDVTECHHRYQVGDEMKFNLSYGGLLSLCTSEYIEKQVTE